MNASFPAESIALRRILAVAFLALLPAVAAWASPPILQLSQSKAEFGSMGQNEVHKQEIRVSNAGGEDLVINEVYVSCPCTVAEIAESVLPPGGETILSISIHSRDFQGPIDKQVEVSSNDPRRPSIEIPVTAFIRAPIQYEPSERQLEFGEVHRGQSAARSISFHTSELDALELVLLDYDADLFEAGVVPGEDPRKATLELGLKPDAPAGSFHELIRLGTNDPGQPTLDFEASGTVLADLMAEPDPVNFRFVKEGQALRQELTIKSFRKGLSFKLTGASVDLPGLSASVISDGAQGEGVVVLEGKPLAKDDPLAKENRGRIRGTLSIATDLAAQPLIEVPVIYLMRL